MTIYKTSNAVVRPDPAKYPVWIVECPNPETLLCNQLKQFFVEMRFAELFPKFGQIRIGNVHPFALLLFQDVMGQKLDLSVFPSITVNDSTEQENYVTIGRDNELLEITNEYYAALVGYAASNRLMVAPSSLSYLQAALATGPVFGVKSSYRGSHRVDINIWTDNKTMTGYIFDMVKALINSKRGELHEAGLDIVENIDGRRSGDISVEFGVLLYGANLTIPITIDAGALRAEINWEIINSVVVDPTYHIVDI